MFFENIMEMEPLLFWSRCSFSIIFSKVFKTLFKIFLIFCSMLSKNRNLCHNLKIAICSEGLIKKFFFPSFNIGVEMLSVQSRGSHQRNDSESYKRNSQLSPISDTDITFDFNVEEDKTDRSVSYRMISPLILMLRLRIAVGNMSGNRCQSDCRSRGRKFDPGPVPYFRED